MLGLDALDLYGELSADDVPRVMQRLMVAMNKKQDRKHLVRDGADHYAFGKAVVVTDPNTGLATITRGCRVIDGGNTDEQTMRRLGAIRELLTFASDAGLSVRWS
jgi:hypothetical protein